mmetsp:Transcript_21968/g.31551  ORF Transcript_21968/g.31551 Transcript_21968/m.31551 type:complete len:285 (-) Transcript_21968:1572-2426(-)
MANSDQLEEIEVLSSIYPSEFELLPPLSTDGTQSCQTHFKVHLIPGNVDEKVHVEVALVCILPETYPSESIPILSIEIKKGLGEAQADELKELADRIATENLGMPSIYSVAEAVKEWLTDNNIPGQDGSMYSEMLRRIQQKEVESKKLIEKAASKAAADNELNAEEVDLLELERIRKRQAGTQVTVESFIAWKAAFDEEMRLKQLLSSSGGAVVKTDGEELLRPTGKQLFLLNKAGQDHEAEALIVAGEMEEEEEDEGDEDYVDEGGESEDDDEDDDWQEEDNN